MYEYNMLQAWKQLQEELTDRRGNTRDESKREVLDYLLTSIIPDELEHWEQAVDDANERAEAQANDDAS